MELVNIRLECLKLAHRADRTASDIIEMAEAFEAYVTREVSVPAETPVAPSKKKSGTSFKFKEDADGQRERTQP